MCSFSTFKTRKHLWYGNSVMGDQIIMITINLLPVSRMTMSIDNHLTREYKDWIIGTINMLKAEMNCYKSHTVGTTCRAGYCLPFRSTWVHPGFYWDSCCSIFNFLCSGFSFCPSFVWSLYCLSFYLQLLITPLLYQYSNFCLETHGQHF